MCVGDGGHGQVFSPKWPSVGVRFGSDRAQQGSTFANGRQIRATGHVGHRPFELRAMSSSPTLPFMKVFVSWSGPASRDFAVALRKYLPCMVPGLQVFMSQHDIESGTQWPLRLVEELSEVNFGLICLTPDNLLSIT